MCFKRSQKSGKSRSLVAKDAGMVEASFNQKIPDELDEPIYLLAAGHGASPGGADWPRRE
jgi:hypothetical protein